MLLATAGGLAMRRAAIHHAKGSAQIRFISRYKLIEYLVDQCGHVNATYVHQHLPKVIPDRSLRAAQRQSIDTCCR